MSNVFVIKEPFKKNDLQQKIIVGGLGTSNYQKNLLL
jgi:hypothetical protein